MLHLLSEVILPIVCSIILLHTAFVLGFFVVKRLGLKVQEASFLFKASVSAIIGYGMLGYISLVLSAVMPLNQILLAVLVLIILAAGNKYLVILYNELSVLWHEFRTNYIWDKLVWLIFFLFLFYLTSAFVPPYRIDALSYHLPEAIEIAQKGVFSLGGLGVFSANLPVLMETLYAFLFTLSGFTLINLVHYQILIFGIMAIFCVVKDEYGKRPTLFSVIGIFTLYDLFVAATNAYVEGATIAFEVVGILSFFLWLKQRNKGFLILSGALYGLALSTKYLPLYSLVAVMLFFGYVEIIKNRNYSFKDIFLKLCYFLVPVIVFGGFWYIKNLIVLGNPFYPFIFGHSGFSEQDLQFKTLMVKDFYPGEVFTPAGLRDFIFLPFVKFLTPYYIPVFLSFFLLPLWWWFRKKGDFITYVFTFFLIYLVEWYFFISHLVRFGMVGWVLLMVYSGIILSEIAKKYSRLIDSKVFKCVMLLVVIAGAYTIAVHKNNYFLQVKKTELSYALGFYSKNDFYNNRIMGDVYSVSQFINENYNNATIINDWSDINFFLTTGNTYKNLVSLAPTLSNQNWEVVCRYLASNNISLIEIDDQAIVRSGDTSTMDNRVSQDLYAMVKKVEATILQHSSLVFEKNDGRLYKISSVCK